MEEVGWNERRKCFVDNGPHENSIRSLFKLYPWETLLKEEFAPKALRTYREMCRIEPIWKMLLSNKGIPSIRWELFPGHELLLEAHAADLFPSAQARTGRPGVLRPGDS